MTSTIDLLAVPDSRIGGGAVVRGFEAKRAAGRSWGPNGSGACAGAACSHGSKRRDREAGLDGG